MFRDGDIANVRRVTRAAELELQRMARREPRNNREYILCDPQGSEARRLRTVLAKLEPLLAKKAEVDNGYGLIIGLADKSRQNPINRLGGAADAGDQAMQAYFDVILGAVELVAKTRPAEDADIKVIRVSPFSDECIILIAGSRLSELTRLEFMRAWGIVRSSINLKNYTYIHDVKYHGDTKRFELDLDAFSRVLKHPEMVVACKCLFSQPELILPFTRGFIQRGITKLEGMELEFYDLLPPSFVAQGDGLAEVETPFDSSLTRRGRKRMNHGSYVEIKLRPEDGDALSLLACVGDRKEKWGTRKGFSEIFSELFGMRGLNTFTGKAHTNRLLTAVANGVYDAAETNGVRSFPVSGCYLRYWIDLPPEQAKKAVQAAIAKRLGDMANPYKSKFEPEVMALGSVGINLSEVRANFVLLSMGLSDLPATVLGQVDFLINFLENVNPIIQQQIFDEMARKSYSGTRIGHADERYLRLVRDVYGFRRTIRDTEDLVWILREDRELPAEVQVQKQNIERWLFEFASRTFDEMQYVLARIIEKERRYRGN